MWDACSLSSLATRAADAWSGDRPWALRPQSLGARWILYLYNNGGLDDKYHRWSWDRVCFQLLIKGSKLRLLSKHWESPGIPDKAPWPLVLSLSRAGSELCDDVMGWRRMSRPLPVTVLIPPHVTTRNSGAGEGTGTATHRGAQSGHKGSLSFRLNYFLKNNIKNKSWIEKPIDKMILGVKMPFSFVSKSMNTKNSGVISFGCICLRSPQLLLFLFMYSFWRFIDFGSKLMHLEIKR